MKNTIHSFKQYVETRFIDELYEALYDYIKRNFAQLNLQSNKVQQIDQANLCDLTVKQVYVDNLPDMAIAFDVLTEAEITITENRHTAILDSCCQWFLIRCTGDLDCNLADFTIQEITTYDCKTVKNQPLDDNLVPVISRSEYDQTATDILKQYYPEALEIPMAINPDLLAERMGLCLDVRPITQEGSIFGQIFFADCNAEFYDPETDTMITIPVKEKTIVVDPAAFYLRNLGSVNNTKVHECVHWCKHRKAFELERLYNEQASQIRCEVMGGIQSPNAATPTHWMELQANVLTPRIQMPLKMFRKKAAEIIRKYRKETGTYELIYILEQVIDELAAFFQVSRCAAKIRMIDMGYEEALGVFTYIDGHYVKPHKFKKNAINRKQTYSISRRDALAESTFNLTLRNALQEGTYQFVESHFCLNHPKYITKDETGIPCLTPYARLHIDECCLIFDLEMKAANKYSEDFYTECVLYRDADANITFDAHYSDSDQEKTQAELLADYTRDILSVLQKLPNSFPEALGVLLDWSDMTLEDIAATSGLSTRHIQRLHHDENQSPSMETLVQLCIGMRLPPQLSFSLISRAAVFKATSLHFTYQLILTAYYNYPLDDCNQLLIEQGFAPLGKKSA